MRIGNRCFPYPVLNNQDNLSTFIHNKFSLKVMSNQDKDKLVLNNLHFELQDTWIEQMINEKKMTIYCIIECSSTVFREVFEIHQTPITKAFDLTNFNNNVTISAFGVLNEKLKISNNSSFIEEYQGFEFTLDKNSILLIDDGETIPINYEEAEDTKFDSIFNVIADANREKNIDIEIGTKKIFINTPKRTFDLYTVMSRANRLQETFFSIMLVPALIHALEKVKKEFIESGFDDIDDVASSFRWFRAISKKYEEIKGAKLDGDVLKEGNIIEISQELIGNPIITGIEKLYEFMHVSVEEEEYD